VIDIILIIVLVILTDTIYSFVLGYREVQILCEQVKDDQTKTSWKFKDYKDWFWQTDQLDKSKSIWDSFHVSNGIAVAIYCILSSVLLVYALGLMWYWFMLIASVRWLYIMQFRNLTIHSIMRK
jgi:hypothetical protein